MAFICKAAFYTIPRFGLSAILLLTVGLFFLFPACHTSLQLREEKLVPWEMIGSTGNEDIALEELLSIEGVKRISPVVQFDAEIQFDEFKLACQVNAVRSSFLDVNLSEGAIFHDDSNMPFILLNKAAAESFSSSNNTKVIVSANTSVIIELNNEATNALICGIFDDKKEAPMVYMSYDFAKKALPQESITTLLFALSNKGYSEEVALSLQSEGITASYEDNDILRWTLMGQQAVQFILTSVGFLACSTILFAKQIHAESKTEIQALLISGMNKATVTQIISGRLIMTYAVCVIVASLIAFFFAVATILGFLFCLIISFLHYWSIQFSLNHSKID